VQSKIDTSNYCITNITLVIQTTPHFSLVTKLSLVIFVAEVLLLLQYAKQRGRLG